MYSAGLLIIASIWKQHKCPSTGECEYYLSIKVNVILTCYNMYKPGNLLLNIRIQ